MSTSTRRPLCVVPKKTALTVIIIILSLSASVWKTQVPRVKAEPERRSVPDEYPTIQRAIDAANPGDTVYIRIGTYVENLLVNKRLTLVGESKESTVIDGSGKNQTIIDVTANDVVITGLTVRNCSRKAGTSYAGIKISGRACNISGNFVTNTKVGILVTSQGSRISKNVLKSNGHGIALQLAAEVAVEGNTASGNTEGISLSASSNNIIVGNRALNGSFGGHGVTLSSRSLNNTLLANALLSNYHGLWLSDSSGNLIVNNTISDNELLGIELAGSSNNTFCHNNIAGNPTPVRVDTGSSGSTCTWDCGYPSGGNYWHDYVDFDEQRGPGQDQIGSDGTWDHPYKIDVNNQDAYPSVKPYVEIRGLVVDKARPTADAGGNKTVSLARPITFDAGRSTDNVGIIAYFWDFGDGTRDTGIVVTHTYNNKGMYTVTLTVKDAADNSDTDTVAITVGSDDPPVLWIVVPVCIGLVALASLFWKRRVRNKRKRMLRETRSRRRH
jgi:parallel beta-helix repeat protein